MTKSYKHCNAEEVLKKVDELINELEAKTFNKRVSISVVYDELSIFDWWKEYLSLSNLKDMRKFLKEAIKFGFTGYVCFKVGVSGCANGMWAHTKESTNGYSPDDCPILYKSFTPAYNYWSYDLGDGWLPDKEGFNSLKTMRAFEKHYLAHSKGM